MRCRSRCASVFGLSLALAGPLFSATPAVSPADRTPLEERWVVLDDKDWQRASSKAVTARDIDELVEKEFRTAKKPVPLTPLTSDEQFLLRVTLDLTGQLPAPAEIAAFVTSGDSDKRAKLIDRLLESEAYARHWARYWRDVVSARVTVRRSMGLTRSFEEWLYEQLRAGANWGDITRSILTAEGELRFSLNTPTSENGALFFLVAHDGDAEAEERAAETSRVFLGTQIQCAQCHDHPTEKWSREQFHELAAYFARIKYEQLFVDKKLAGVKLVTLTDREHRMASLSDPDKFSPVHPSYLDGRAPGKNLSDRDRRRALADSIVSNANPWFAAAYVNRVWGELMGQSFYRHVDDLGPAKEVLFPEVLTTLTHSFQTSNYDIRAMFRVILNSHAYQRQAFLDPARGRLRADVLWDSLVHVLGKLEHGARFHTGSGVRFNGSFLEGRFRAEFDFDPSLDAEDVKGTIPQALFLMNNSVLNKSIQATRTSTLGALLKECPDDTAAVTRLYVLTLARKPTDRELKRCLAHVAEISVRAEAFEDLLWALMNSTEFQRRR